MSGRGGSMLAKTRTIRTDRIKNGFFTETENNYGLVKNAILMAEKAKESTDPSSGIIMGLISLANMKPSALKKQITKELETALKTCHSKPRINDMY